MHQPLTMSMMYLFIQLVLEPPFIVFPHFSPIRLALGFAKNQDDNSQYGDSGEDYEGYAYCLCAI